MYGYNSFYTHFLIFYLIYGGIITLLFNSLQRNKRVLSQKSLLKILFLALPLYLLGILRGDTVGGDLIHYLSYFDEMCRINSINSIWDISSHEPGYRIYTYLISRISHSHRAFFIGTFTLSFIGPIYMIYKYSKMPCYSFVLYYALGFYTNTFNNVRQSIAISICFISLGFLLNRNFRKFLLTVITATMFHYSAVFFLILYPLVNKEVTLRKVLYLLGGGIVIYMIFSVIVISFLLNVLSFKYNAETILLASEGAGRGMLTLYVLILLAELLLYFRIKNNETKKKKLSFFIYMQLMAVLFQMYAPLFASMARLTYYFYIPIIIVIPYLAYSFKPIRSIIISTSVALSILFLGMVYSKSEATGSNMQVVIPYVFIDKTIY